MLSQTHKEHYREKGWTVVEGIFERAHAQRIAELALSFGEESAHLGYDVDASDDGRRAPRKIDKPFEKDESFRAFVLNERLRDVIRELLGGEPLLIADQIFLKPPHFGSAKPYHQDNAYFRCSPPDEVLTAWIALDDADEANGCLRYIDGSHRGAILPHEPVSGEGHNLAPPDELIDFSKESLAPVRCGGVVFHHSQTLHTSHRNNSERWRRGYATHWVTSRVTAQSTILDSAHFKSELYPTVSPRL